MKLSGLVVLCAACGSPSTHGGNDGAVDTAKGGDSADALNVMLPPVNAKYDYQRGGPYAPPAGVTVVTRDYKAAKAEGMFNICYVNGFQIERSDEMFWVTSHPDLILRDGNGTPIRDPKTTEILLDTGLAEKRTAIASIVGDSIAQCANIGYPAIQIDNIDSYTRSQGLLTEQQAVYTMKMLSDHAHAMGRAIGQQNGADIVARRAELGTDFAVAEECNRNGNCAKYTAGYGDHVIVIEYRQQDFTAGCTAYPNLSIVLRDANLVTAGASGYLYDGC